MFRPDEFISPASVNVVVAGMFKAPAAVIFTMSVFTVVLFVVVILPFVI